MQEFPSLPKIDEHFSRLPTPLHALKLEQRQPGAISDGSGAQLAFCKFLRQEEWQSGALLMGTFLLGEIQIICFKTTPLGLKHLNNGHVSVGMSYFGNTIFEQGGSRISAAPGDLLFCPNHGGMLTTDLCSGIAFQFEPRRLLRTIAIMLGHEDNSVNLTDFQVIPTSRSSANGQPGGLIRTLCAFFDRLLHDNELLPEAMGMEEQFFRSLALELMHANGKLDGLRRRRYQSQRDGFLDELVDFILANLDRPITLTDLEERSHYSGRQLQYVFRRKFDCTPLQFVRRQRLKYAMSRLEQAKSTDTITAIARELGYRSASSFSADFFRQFGSYPSVVLRSIKPRTNLSDSNTQSNPNTTLNHATALAVQRSHCDGIPNGTKGPWPSPQEAPDAELEAAPQPGSADPTSPSALTSRSPAG
jgi:AraC-like DNA-binding protein